MKFLNIGPVELLLIVAIAIIVLGPERALESLRSLAVSVRKIIQSPFWQETKKEITTLPDQLVRETGMEETIKDIRSSQTEISQSLKSVNSLVNNTTVEILKETKKI